MVISSNISEKQLYTVNNPLCAMELAVPSKWGSTTVTMLAFLKIWRDAKLPGFVEFPVWENLICSSLPLLDLLGGGAKLCIALVLPWRWISLTKRDLALLIRARQIKRKHDCLVFSLDRRLPRYAVAKLYIAHLALT